MTNTDIFYILECVISIYYHVIKLLSHTIKIKERIIEIYIMRKKIIILDNQFDFMS